MFFTRGLFDKHLKYYQVKENNQKDKTKETTSIRGFKIKRNNKSPFNHVNSSQESIPKVIRVEYMKQKSL